MPCDSARDAISALSRLLACCRRGKRNTRNSSIRARALPGPEPLPRTTVRIGRRFRIVALLKLLARDDLDRERRHAVCDALIEKCRIYGAGAARRGRVEEAHFVAELAKLSGCAWLTSPDIALQFAIDRSRRNFGDSDFQVEQGLG